MKKRDLTGQRFGRLTVVSAAESRKRRNGGTRLYWNCVCDCGNGCVVSMDSLLRGGTLSCGCYREETRGKPLIKHGLSGKRIYQEWNAMKGRCCNKNNKSYGRYGGRGITVCDAWKDSFESFYEWATANGYSDNLTIERIDINKGYAPENCYWIPPEAQAKNRSTTLRIEDDNGDMQYVMDIAKENGIPMNIVIARKCAGWDLKKALYTPVIDKTRKRSVLKLSIETGEVLERYKSIGDASRDTCVDRSSISRCCLGERKKAGGFAWIYEARDN